MRSPRRTRSDVAASGTGVHLLQHAPELRVRSPAGTVHHLLAVVIHRAAALGASHRGSSHDGDYWRRMFSRPYRSVFAIQISSPRNLSIRRTKDGSCSSPSSLKTLPTPPKFTSQKMVTRPSSRSTGSEVSITRVPPKGPADTA